MISPEEIEVHIAAWVKLHHDQKDPERGFTQNNFRRYNFSNESGLRRWLKRNRLQQTDDGRTNRDIHQPLKASKGRDNNKSTTGSPQGIQQVFDYTCEDIEHLDDYELSTIKYGSIEPSLHISELSLDDWIDEFIPYDYFTDDPKLISKLKEEWRQEYLTIMRNRLWLEEQLQVWLPRGYGKTESVLALYIRWFLEIRKSMYIVAPAYSHNKEILRRMVSIIKSPKIRRKYGDILGNVSYDREKITALYDPIIGYISKDPPLSMVTWQGAKEGPHPAWLIFDDTMQKEFKSIESNDDIKYKFAKTFKKMITRRAGRKTKVSVIGTRYGMEDMYSYLRDTQKIPVLHNRALNEDGTWLYCPNYTLQDLIDERQIDISAFETTMNNNPIPSSGVFFSADHWIERAKVNCVSCYNAHTPHHPWVHEQGVNYYCAIDPNKGMTDSADNAAIIIFGILRGIGMVVDGFVGKTTDILKEYDHFYNTYNLTWTLVEKTFAQIDMNRFAQYRGIIPYTDTTPKAKYMRIDAMRPYFTAGLIQVLKQDSVQDKKEGKPYQFLYT